MSATPRDLAWDDVKLVKSIADARGLGGAAERLGVNHSTVFRRLGLLEEELGVTLFERHRSGYVPTPTGEAMVALAERMDEDVSGFIRRLAGQELLPAGELRVATNDSLLAHLLTPLFAAFRERYPDVRLDIVLGNQALNLSRRDADVAIRATDNPPENLVGRRVARIGWALYGRTEDFPGPDAVAPAALFQRQWISLGDDLAALKAARFVRENVAPERIVYKVNTVFGLAEAVNAGIGIGHLPCFIAGKYPGLVRLSALMPEFAADLWLLTHPDLRHSPRVRAFLDFLAGEIARQRAALEGEPTEADGSRGAA